MGRVVDFLLEIRKYISGVNITVDGGQSLKNMEPAVNTDNTDNTESDSRRVCTSISHENADWESKSTGCQQGRRRQDFGQSQNTHG